MSTASAPRTNGVAIRGAGLSAAQSVGPATPRYVDRTRGEEGPFESRPPERPPQPSAPLFLHMNERLALITSRVLDLVSLATNFNQRTLGATGAPELSDPKDDPPNFQAEEMLLRLTLIETYLTQLEAEVQFTNRVL